MAGNGAATFLEAALSFPGIDPNMSDNEGNTPLHFAAQAGNYPNFIPYLHYKLYFYMISKQSENGQISQKQWT